jgi:hypothetical protein
LDARNNFLGFDLARFQLHRFFFLNVQLQ